MPARRVAGYLAAAGAALLGLTPELAHSQECAGLPSLRERPVIVTADISGGKDAWSLGAGLTAGRAAFVGVYVDRATYQNVGFAATTADARSTDIGAAAGYEFRLGPLGLCPVASGQWETGPDGSFAGNQLDSDGWTVGAGMSAGGVLVRTAGLRIIPSASVTFQRVSSTVHDFPFINTDSHAHDTGWLVGLGIGVAVGALTLEPSVTIPSGLEGGVTTFSLSVNVGVGR